MTFASFNSVFNVKAVVDTFNQEKALVGSFFVIVKLRISFGNLRLKLCRSLLTAHTAEEC